MSTYDDVVLADSPIAYWKMDELTLPFADSAGSNPITSMTTNTYYNSAISLSAVTSATIECLVPILFDSATYVMTRNSGLDGFVLAVGNPMNAGLPSLALSFGLNGNSFYMGRRAQVSLGTNRHHVVGTWSIGGNSSISTSQFALYVDGTQVDNGSNAIGSRNETSVTTGYLQVGTAAFVRNVALYDVVLTAEQVKTHYMSSPMAALSGSWGWSQ